MFESYFLHQTTYFQTARKPISVAFLAHVFIIGLIILAPYLVIKQIQAPISAMSVFEALPPPPPPPAGGTATKPKDEVKPKEPDTLKEPDKPQEIPKPDEKPKVEGGVVGGVDGGVQGGVVGGVLSDIPPTLLVKSQQKLSGDMPNFPAAARAQGLSATIAARICISAYGDVTSVKILRGSPGFDAAVEKALLSWKYQPYIAGSSAVPACFPVYFNFNLKE